MPSITEKTSYARTQSLKQAAELDVIEVFIMECNGEGKQGRTTL